MTGHTKEHDVQTTVAMAINLPRFEDVFCLIDLSKKIGLGSDGSHTANSAEDQ